MPRHEPEGAAFIAVGRIYPDYPAGHHEPQAATGVEFPVSGQFGKAVFPGYPSSLDKADKLPPVHFKKSQQAPFSDGIPIRSLAVFSRRVDHRSIVEPVKRICPHPVKAAEGRAFVIGRGVVYPNGSAGILIILDLATYDCFPVRHAKRF